LASDANYSAEACVNLFLLQQKDDKDDEGDKDEQKFFCLYYGIIKLSVG
jgi:hypothetical protein